MKMRQIGELSKELNQTFNWNKARMDCFVGMLIALLKLRSINLTELAIALPSTAQKESRYRRIQRFICGHFLDFDKVALFIMQLFQFLDSDFYLTLDRTNWKWGEKNINILMLAVVYKGVAIPIYWVLLNKKGNSSTRERIALMKRFIRQFGQQHIISLLADREFIGGDWLKWLKSEGIGFVIRIKKDALVPNSQGKGVQVQKLFWFLKPGEQWVIKDKRKMTGVDVYLSGLRLADGELLIVATDLPGDNAIETYAARWQIETLFACLKRRGFNIEDTHVTNRLRIKRLLVVAVVAFCWAHRSGEWLHENVKPIKVKTHQRLARSIFRAGLDFIREVLLNVSYSLEQALRLIIQFIDFNKPFEVR
jgi:hypothetical protein